MIVKGRLQNGHLDLNNLTKHIGERKNRLDVYFKVKDIGEVFDTFIVDKDHPNGDEVHVITDTGFILIFNHRTKRFITVLHARPAQLKRYYLDLGEGVPSKIISIAGNNQKLNDELDLNNK
jgi:predicted RNA-binding protein associated with RNAse of E/G family